jgi:hypothetical protein
MTFVRAASRVDGKWCTVNGDTGKRRRGENTGARCGCGVTGHTGKPPFDAAAAAAAAAGAAPAVAADGDTADGGAVVGNR